MSVKMLVKLSTLQESTDNVSHLWTKLLFILRSQMIQRLLWVINQCSAPYTYHKSWFSKPRDLRCGVNHVHAIARPLSMISANFSWHGDMMQVFKLFQYTCGMEQVVAVQVAAWLTFAVCAGTQQASCSQGHLVPYPSSPACRVINCTIQLWQQDDTFDTLNVTESCSDWSGSYCECVGQDVVAARSGKSWLLSQLHCLFVFNQFVDMGLLL